MLMGVCQRVTGSTRLQNLAVKSVFVLDHHMIARPGIQSQPEESPHQSHRQPFCMQKEEERKVYATQVQLRALRKGPLTSKLGYKGYKWGWLTARESG
eukprot:1153805-Pelagomonas_calceolata.AAC.8